MLQVGVTTAEETSIEVTGLKVNTSYHFRVTARNDIGHSHPYAPEEPITAGKRISKSKFTVLVLLNWSDVLSAISSALGAAKCYTSFNHDCRLYSVTDSFSHFLCKVNLKLSFLHCAIPLTFMNHFQCNQHISHSRWSIPVSFSTVQ